MDMSDIATAPKIASWMVDMLFGQQGQAKTEPSPVPTAAPAVAVTSSAKPSVAAATGQAIAALPAGGDDVGPDASQETGLTVAQLRNNIKTNQNLTSSEISAALYNGQGLLRADTIHNGPYDTFSSAVDDQIFYDQILISHAGDASESGDAAETAQLEAFGEAEIEQERSMLKAFEDHKVSFQKLSDIPGLNYQSSPTYGGIPTSAPTSGSLSETYDRKAMQSMLGSFDAVNRGSLLSIGGVMLLATWTDTETEINP